MKQFKPIEIATFAGYPDSRTIMAWTRRGPEELKNRHDALMLGATLLMNGYDAERVMRELEFVSQARELLEHTWCKLSEVIER